MSEEGKPFILVCQNGFVLFACRRPSPDDYMFWILDNCCVIRRWGTTRGLGQLALTGPTSATEIDPEPDGTELLKVDVKRALPVNEEAFKKWIGKLSTAVPS